MNGTAKEESRAVPDISRDLPAYWPKPLRCYISGQKNKTAVYKNCGFHLSRRSPFDIFAALKISIKL